MSHYQVLSISLCKLTCKCAAKWLRRVPATLVPCAQHVETHVLGRNTLLPTPGIEPPRGPGSPAPPLTPPPSTDARGNQIARPVALGRVHRADSPASARRVTPETAGTAGTLLVSGPRARQSSRRSQAPQVSAKHTAVPPNRTSWRFPQGPLESTTDTGGNNKARYWLDVGGPWTHRADRTRAAPQSTPHTRAEGTRLLTWNSLSL